MSEGPPRRLAARWGRRWQLALLLALMGCTASGPAAPQPTSVDGLAVPDGAQQAVVVRHTDGDTVVLRGIGTGPLPGGAVTKVRLLEVDTPEIYPNAQCYGTKAADRTAALLPKGSRVRVQRDRELKDRYGRTLFYLWTPQGVSLEEILLREGLARVLYVRPNNLHLDRFRSLEAAARRDRVGRWADCPAVR